MLKDSKELLQKSAETQSIIWMSYEIFSVLARKKQNSYNKSRNAVLSLTLVTLWTWEKFNTPARDRETK